jgi:pyridoxamine 5'-phosphate oxidase
MTVSDPIGLFREWFAAAEAAGAPLPDAMTLATAGADARPSARTVLLKGVDERGFVFFTNYESRKGQELTSNPRGALVFVWHMEPKRQVLVQGRVERVPREESEAYFATRPRGSRLAALVSNQSRPLESRKQLEDAFAEAESMYSGDVPLPEHWGGFVLEPETIEFWESRPNRLHERVKYSKNEDRSWRAEPLAP